MPRKELIMTVYTHFYNADLLILKPVVIGFPDSNRLILYKIIMLYIFADLYLISNFRYKNSHAHAAVLYEYILRHA